MGAEAPARRLDATAFATALLRDRELTPRARRILSALADVLPDAALVLYVAETVGDNEVWRARAIHGEIRVDVHALDDVEIFQQVVAAGEPAVYSSAQLSREAYAHLDFRRTLASLALIPLISGKSIVAVLEVISFSAVLRAESLEVLSDAVDIAALAISSALEYEKERNSQMASITRITQFYDLEKTFNSIIEIEDLLPVIASKFRELLNAQAVNLWMVETKETLLLTNRAGTDTTVAVGSAQTQNGIAYHVSESGEHALIEDPRDEQLAARNTNAEIEIFTLIAMPLMDGEKCVGVAEAINKLDGTSFDEDDIFLLTTITQTASNALHNAGLLQAERKAQALEMLVEVSNEITSTLDLDRVLQTVVNAAQAVIPFERSSIALERAGHLQLQAVSGMRRINFGDSSVVRLRDLLEWLSFTTDEIYVKQTGEQLSGAPADQEAGFRDYFAATNVRGFYARPLADDQGRLGVLVYESQQPEFLNSAHFELIKIISGQATVALRNAQLYQEVPFINLIEPLMKRKRRFLAMEKRLRISAVTLAVATLLFLVFCPVPMRVSGEASVAPVRKALVQPEFDGVVHRVLVREGDRVRRGFVLAEMDDTEFRQSLTEDEAKYTTAVSEMDRALAANDGTTAGVQRANVAYWSAEVGRARERLERTKLRSPIDGVVTTAFVENLTGRKFDAGDLFAEVEDTSHATVDVAIDEQDVSLLREGMPAAVKLDGYPTQTFHGLVQVLSPKSEAVGDQRVFFARVDVSNVDGLVRPGMQGRGKISAGWHPAGYVLFRRPGSWFWSKIWSWFGF